MTGWRGRRGERVTIMVARRILAAVVIGLCLAGRAAAAPPTQEDALKSISRSVDSGDSVSGRAMVGITAAAVGVVLLAVVVNARQNRRDQQGWSTAGGGSAGTALAVRPAAAPASHPGKLVRELMRETGLTKAQLRQLEAANDRLAEDGRAVEHLATLLLCPSLLTASKSAVR